MGSIVKASDTIEDGDRVIVHFESGEEVNGHVLTTGTYGMEPMAWVSLGDQREACVPISYIEVTR